MQKSRFSTFTRSHAVAVLLATVTGMTHAQTTDLAGQMQASPTTQAMHSGQQVPTSQGMQEALPSTTTPSIVARPPQRMESAPANRGQRETTPRESKPSEFMLFVEKVTGKSLPTFGRDLFTNFSSNFTPLESTQVNPDYTIGTGDNIEIRGWGMIDIDVNAVVDRNGEIYIPRVGSVKVAGVRYSDLQGHLKKAVGRIFNNFELTASLSQTRAVQVYVVGHATRPGTYVLNSMSTLLNALFTSGGPNQTGSMRNIQLRRGDRVISNFDLYKMILAGDKSGDMSLKDGDVIFIPEVGPQVAVIGNVKKPAIYELTANSSVSDVISWSGGIDSAAAGKRVIVEKNVNNRFETIADLTAEDAQLRTRLGVVPTRPADILRVFSPGAVPVQAQVTNEYVRVSGEAARTGVFRLEMNETLRSLVSRLGGTTQFGYVYATQLNREAIRLQQQERLNEIGDRFEREIDAAASRRLAGVTDRDSLAAISADIERQRELAQRMRSVRAEGRVVLEMADASAQVKNLPDIPLRDGDTVHIPRRPDTVDVLGAVFQQSTFIFKPNRQIKDYVKLAGGPTETADMSSMYVIRPDGTVQSGEGWFRRIGGTNVNPGDTIVIPENVDRSTWRQSLKEWTAIFYQFGLGAAGLKVLKD